MKTRSRQFAEERHAVILKLVKESGRVTVEDLCHRFSISLATARNDLKTLEEMGRIRRTHGGALAAEFDSQPLPFSTRRMYYGEEKRAISRAAAQLIKDGELIFIDGGTTAAEMRVFFGDKQGVTIITPSLEVGRFLTTTTKNVSVYMLNGFVNSDSLATVGAPDEEFIARTNIAWAFCGAAGLTLQDGLTDLDMGFVEQKRVICRYARKVVGLVDHSKIGVTSLGSFAGIDQIHTVITDRALPDDMAGVLQERGIAVVVAEVESKGQNGR
jgi:DeoR/GlpR family transcriptional regulator of sugar metabolism